MTSESIIFMAKEWAHNPTSCDHIFRHLARENTVLWVNSITTRSPNVGSAGDWRKILHKLRICLGGLTQISPSGWLYQPIFIPLPFSNTARALNRFLLRWSIRRQVRKLGMAQPQLWFFQPNGSFLIGELNESVVVYYCVDQWSALPDVNRNKLAEMERDLVRRADVCFATSKLLAEAKRTLNPNTVVALHGVDHELFSKALASDLSVPADVAGLSRPVIGYFGHIDHRIDVGLLGHLASSRPQWSIVLIGNVTADITEIRSFPNVFVLGPRSQEVLPAYCKLFDVGIIPWHVNEWSRNANPIKLREYVSAGLPTVAVDLPAVRDLDELVFIAKNHDDFVACIERALTENTPEHRTRRSRAMQNEGWYNKIDAIADVVMRVKRGKQA
jgi:hypothetical protein